MRFGSIFEFLMAGVLGGFFLAIAAHASMPSFRDAQIPPVEVQGDNCSLQITRTFTPSGEFGVVFSGKMGKQTFQKMFSGLDVYFYSDAGNTAFFEQGRATRTKPLFGVIFNNVHYRKTGELIAQEFFFMSEAPNQNNPDGEYQFLCKNMQ